MNNFYLIRRSILLPHMISFCARHFPIARLVVHFLDSCQWYRRSVAGRKLKTRLGIGEVIV
jgi:hypothetical protein